MFKKVNRNFENKYGIINSNGDFPNRPCILGIVPMSSNLKLFNGYMNLYMYMLQIRRSKDIDSSYDIKDVPFDLLMRNYKDDVVSIVLKNIPANNIMEAKMIMRNINIISYCNGNNETGLILKKLYQGLINMGYSEQEVKEILSQIFVLQIVDNYYDGKNNKLPYATVVTVHDIYDFENTDYYFEEQEESMFKENPFIHLKSDNNNDRYVLYKSFGEGSLADRKDEHIFEYDYAKAPIINYTMALYLIKALHMSINHIEIKNNISLENEINELIRKVGEFVKRKGKKYNDFTKEDLNDLNNYLMPFIQEEFKKNIPVKLLSDEEKNYLDDVEYSIQQFFKENKYLKLDESLVKLDEYIGKVLYINDNAKEDEIVVQEPTNDGIIEYNKAEAIKHYVNYFILSYFNEFMSEINNVKIPDNLSEYGNKIIKEYLSSLLIRAKSLVLNEKFQEIIDEYCDNEIKSKLSI